MRWGWLIWDALAILAFTLIGMHFHKMPFSMLGVARTLVPFCLGWFGMALLTGLYRARSPWWAFPAVCLLGVSIGAALRAWVFMGRGVSLTTISQPFLIFSLLFMALFTGLPRLMVGLIRHVGHVRRVRAG
ncbi:MAG: DUF3054 domain-containing protein [Fimbriimonadales bacterium]|nr:DUF3054 domain-containing protein [Fimbriimonadales bacterium]